MASLENKRKKKPLLSPRERKRRRQETYAKINRTRMVLGNEFERWKMLKNDVGVKTDSEMATFLIDSYMDKQKTDAMPGTSSKYTAAKPGTSGMSTSTPIQAKGQRVMEIRSSEISSVESDTSEKTLTGVESIPDTDQSGNGISRVPKPMPAVRSRKYVVKKTSESFLDPFELSIDVTHEADDEHDDYDSDYEASFAFTAVFSEDVNKATANITFEEMEFGWDGGVENEAEKDDVTEESATGSSVPKIETEEECVQLTEDITCLVFLSQLIDLAQTPTRKKCQDCGSPIHIDQTFIGSALYLKWTCEKGHILHRWCSQPVLNRRLHSGDFLSALSIAYSGNNFGKVALLAKLLNLKFLSASSFHRIQTTYLIPTVDNYWRDHQNEVMAMFRDRDLIVLGDGRMDSPGHSAQYCSYTLMENTTKRILALKTLDKRQTDRKSVNMEKAGFQLCMADMEDNGITVTEVVTDAHLGIGALMRTQYPNIKHSNDIWHAAKNLGKKILKVGQRKGCNVLLKWSKDIVNHFWFCCKQANSYPEFMSIWRSLLHHITNQHSWVLAHGDGVNQCQHGPLMEDTRNKPWLDKNADGEALSALASVMLDKRFLNRIHYLLNFRSTAELEVFNQLILMYCAKRYSYKPPVYRMRNLLAAIDHNCNVERALRKNKDGSIIYNRYYNKKSGRWSVFPLKVEKSYQHIRTMAQNALVMRLNDKVGMASKELEADDPRRISRHLAPVAPPPTQELVQQHVSRFAKETEH